MGRMHIDPQKIFARTIEPSCLHTETNREHLRCVSDNKALVKVIFVARIVAMLPQGHGFAEVRPNRMADREDGVVILGRIVKRANLKHLVPYLILLF